VEKSGDWPIGRLRREGFSEVVIQAIEALTKRPGEEFYDLVKHAGQNEIGKSVKRADINDHLRYFAPGKNREKYVAALTMLQDAMT
jgi:cobalamin biosynthesis Co2+ chelatase CbiK